jgi:hypothetical protein
MLAPEAEDEPVMELAMLAPEAEDEPVMELAMLAPEAEDEPVVELAMLAPSVDDVADEVAEEDEPVLELAMLAPDAAPSSSAVETVMDVAELAPMPEIRPEIGSDIGSEIEEPVFDLATLAPSNLEPDVEVGGTPSASAVPPAMVPDEEPVFELDALAPAEVDLVATDTTGSTGSADGSTNGRMPDEQASEIGFVSPVGGPAEPDEVIIDLDALRVEPTVASAGALPSGPLEVEISAAGPTAPEAGQREESADSPPDGVGPASPSDADTPSDDQGEPIFTRTLAELYAAQGAVKEAVSVLRHLLAESPGDDALSRRIAELESGAPIARAPRDDVPAALPGQGDEEVEALARELAESGRGSHETDSPFAWTDRESAPSPPSGPTIREYFDGLLKWEPRDS